VVWLQSLRVTSEARLAAGIFVYLLVASGYFFGGGGWNQNAHFSLVRAIVEQGSFRIDQFPQNTGDVSMRDGMLFANKAPGASFLAVPPYAIAYSIERMLGVDPSETNVVTFNAWLCTVVVCGGAAALIGFILFLYGRRVGVRSEIALLVAVLTVLATPIWAFSTVLFAHVPSAAMLLLAIVAASRYGWRWALLSGIAAGVAACSNYLALAVLPLIALQLLSSTADRRSHRLLAFACGAAPFLLLLGFYQRIAFGGWFATPAEGMNEMFVTPGAVLGIVQMPRLAALWGITFSPFRGLFYVAPVALLGVVALLVWLRKRERLAEALTVTGVVLFFFAFNVSFNGWHGGNSFGPRYLIPLLPLLALALYRLPRKRSSLLLIALLLASFSLLNSFAATAVDPQPSEQISHPLRDYIYPLLLTGEASHELSMEPPWLLPFTTGHTSVNRQAMDEPHPLVRHRPGSAEAEWASFNLGEVLTGPGHAASLLPIILWLIAGGYLLTRSAMKLAPHDASD
jgi:hypothetical protein